MVVYPPWPFARPTTGHPGQTAYKTRSDRPTQHDLAYVPFLHVNMNIILSLCQGLKYLHIPNRLKMITF